MQFPTLFPVHNPGKRAHPQNEICLTQKGMNFGNAMFLCYLRPEKCQKPYPERHEFWKCHVSSLPEAREMPKKKKKKPYPERHEFRKHPVSLLPEAREMPKILRILATPKFFTTLSRESPKPTTKDTNFAPNCTH